MDELWIRTLSALCAIPLVILLIYQGPPYFDIAGFCILIGLLREWSRLSTFSSFHPFNFYIIIQSILILYSQHFPFYIKLILNSSLCCMLVLSWTSIHQIKNKLLYIIGCLYIALPILILINLCHKGLAYQNLILWLFIVIWANDIGAYLWGRSIGGAKLIPAISPNKTWSGLIGGVLCGTIIGLKTGYIWSVSNLFIINFAFICFMLSIASHLGDLLESYIKRYYGVKDAGNLIPGHGGLLDRLDSLLFVTIVMETLNYFK